MRRLSCRRTEKYLEYLAAFAAAHSNPEKLAFDWTSPLGRQPDRFQRFQGLPYEHAMVRCSACIQTASAISKYMTMITCHIIVWTICSLSCISIPDPEP